MKHGGRPRKADQERRIESVRADLTVAEKTHVRRQAAKAGLSEAEYTRRRVLGFEVTAAARRSFDPALVAEVNRVGVNVNQLTRSVHMGREFTAYWNEIGTELKAVLAKVAHAYGPETSSEG